MKLKNIIRSYFLKESKKEFKHISELEKQILARVKQEEELDSELERSFLPQRPFWTFKFPLAFASVVAVILFISIVGNSTVFAKSPIIEALVNLRNALQQELTDILTNDPEYRDKTTQKYQQAEKELCLVSARSAEEREMAVEAIRDFLDRPDAVVEYECIRNSEDNSDEQPQREIYTVDFDRFVIDTKTNTVIEMSEIGGSWGTNKDGTRWFSPQKTYDHTPLYTKEDIEQIAKTFIENHKKALGDISLNELALEVGKKESGEGQLIYFLTWRGEGGSLSIAFTQAGQLVSYFNEFVR